MTEQVMDKIMDRVRLRVKVMVQARESSKNRIFNVYSVFQISFLDFLTIDISILLLSPDNAIQHND